MTTNLNLHECTAIQYQILAPGHVPLNCWMTIIRVFIRQATRRHSPPELSAWRVIRYFSSDPAKSRETMRFLMSKWSYPSKVRQAFRQQRCRNACQISERSHNTTHISRIGDFARSDRIMNRDYRITTWLIVWHHSRSYVESRSHHWRSWPFTDLWRQATTTHHTQGLHTPWWPQCLRLYNRTLWTLDISRSNINRYCTPQWQKKHFGQT